MCEHIGHTEARSAALPVDVLGPASAIWDLGKGDWDNGRARTLLGPLPLPQRCWLSRLSLDQVSADAEPDSVTWWLETGDGTLTDVVTTTWVTGKGVASRLDQLYDLTTTSSTIYVRAFANGGSNPIVRPVLTWKVLADLDLTCAHRERLALRKAALGGV